MPFLYKELSFDIGSALHLFARTILIKLCLYSCSASMRYLLETMLAFRPFQLPKVIVYYISVRVFCRFSSIFSDTLDSQREGGGFKSPWGQRLFWAEIAGRLHGSSPGSSQRHASICSKRTQTSARCTDL